MSLTARSWGSGMFDQIAAAIIAGLVSGAGKVGAEAVSDAYGAARQALRDLVPSLSSEAVDEDPQGAEDHLSTVLAKLDPAQVKALVEKFRLAEAGGEDEQALYDAVLRMRNVEVGRDAAINLKSGNRYHMENFKIRRDLIIG